MQIQRKGRPGDKLRLETKIIRKKGTCRCRRGSCDVDGKVVVSAVLTFGRIDKVT